MLVELAELETTALSTEQTHDTDSLAWLCDYVREFGTAWREADKPNKHLLVQTFFEQLWVVGDRINAAKPVVQFVPFFRLIRNLNGDDPDQRYFLAPGIIWELEEMELTAEQVSDTAKEIAHDLDDHGQLVLTPLRVSHGVQTGGPDGRLRGKSHMEPIWRANGWDEQAPVTRHEARLRRDALRELGLSDAHVALFDDPWQMLEHQQDLFGYVVGRPNTTTPATDCPADVDVSWLRCVIPEDGETNHSRWPTDPTWAVVQAASFTEAPIEARHLIRREVRSSRVEKRDVASYGLLVSRTAIACADPKH